MFKRTTEPVKKDTPVAGGNLSAARRINFEQSWGILHEGFKKLLDFLGSNLKKPFNHSEYASLYTTCYDLCTQKVETGKPNTTATEILYDRYQSSIAEYLTQQVVPALRQRQGEALMMEAVRRWNNHQIVVRWLQKLFVYLDRYYTRHNNRDSLKDVGMKCYQSMVYESIKTDMSKALLNKVHAERQGELIDRNVMKDGIQLFIEMGLNTLTAYEKDFEAPLIAESATFYKAESARWITEDSCPEYLIKAEKRLKEEHERCKVYLHPNTEPHLIKVVEAELITKHQTRLLEMDSGFLNLLRDYKLDDLRRMYQLFKRVNGLTPMAEKTKTFITEEGLTLVKTHQAKEKIDTNDFIQQLLDMHEKYQVLVTEYFDKEICFMEALKDAFTVFVNRDLQLTNAQTNQTTTTNTAELLATFCDKLMKDTGKLGEQALEDILEKVVRLFGYISEKDLFQEFYRKQLSKRLLLTKTNDEAERSLIARLKRRCGASFTARLEGMITDKNLSEDIQNQFKNWVNEKGIKLKLDFQARVLTTGFWPMFKTDTLNVPEDLSACMTAFKDYYDTRTQSRVLKWIHSLGQAQLNANYESGTKELSLSAYQACILLLFNQSEELTCAEIQKILSLPTDDVKRSLFGLTFGKYSLLSKKNDKKKGVDMDDVFVVNRNFENPSRRIKVPNIMEKFTDDEIGKMRNDTLEDRKHAIEAAIVRIMKTRKQLSHNDLVMEVSKQLMQYFMPEPKIIKRRIEDLINRDYLERDKSKQNFYNYLA